MANRSLWLALAALSSGCQLLIGIEDATLLGPVLPVDECAIGAAVCDAHATCADTPEAYTCSCSAGWTGDGKTCADVNECALAESCTAHAVCANTAGSFSCACGPGYLGDGASCRPETYEKISVGSSASCAIASDGTLWCWGSGRTVPGADVGGPQARPVQVGTDDDWTALEMSTIGSNGCGLREGGTLWCWGENRYGTAGDGSFDVRPDPVQVPSATGWRSVAFGGYNRVCAIRGDGTLWCWGFLVPSMTATPQPVGGVGAETDWIQITSGIQHACGLREGGTLWCWGNNAWGQVGDGAPMNQPLPVPISGGPWLSVASRSQHTCAIKAEGTLWCWGHNAMGEVGGTNGIVVMPAKVGNDMDWVAVAVDSEATCGIRGASRTLSCWGMNDRGTIGDGTRIARSAPTPPVSEGDGWKSVSGGHSARCGLRLDGRRFCWGSQSHGALGDGAFPEHNAPYRIGTLDVWARPAVSNTATCAIRLDGSLYCWGATDYGGTAQGDVRDAVEAPARVGFSNTWSTLTASFRNLCGITAGKLFCWGDNHEGQVGIGPTADPVPTATAVMPADSWRSVGTGGCTVAVKQTDSRLWAWGNNGLGECGDGTFNPVPDPKVIGTATWSQVGAMSEAACGIQTDGSLWCWGSNYLGQLGDGTTIEKGEPTPIGGRTDWTALGFGWDYACGIAGGELYCWGNNVGGQLGDGTQIQRLVPTRVGSDRDWASVTGSWVTTCAIKTSGALYCWGDNLFGTVGVGTWQRTYLTPQQVGTDTDWAAVSLNDTACATRTSGSLWCWGENGAGNYGLGLGGVIEPRAAD